jgi:predicted transcriptional regulator
VRQVLEALPAEGGDPPAYTTVMTMMTQLAEKGALSVDRERQPFVYAPAVQREQILGARLREFLHTVFDGQAETLALHLVEEGSLSPDALRRIEARIKEREKTSTSKESRRKEPKRERHGRTSRGR